MKVLPPLLTGNSPPSRNDNRPVAAARPRFQGLPDNAISQFVSDTLGVWAPKVPLTRSKTQFFEDAFLELVEDGAFYFTLPIVGPLLARLLANKLIPLSGLNQKLEAHNAHPAVKALKEALDVKDAKELTGVPMGLIRKEFNKLKLDKATVETLERELLKPLIANKVGALLGTVAVAAGFEYMIQHTKNVITAKQFKIKNFAAVAGLEGKKAETQPGETDPVVKAKRRTKQVGAFVLGSLLTAIIAPKLFLKVGSQRAEKVMHWIDFDKGFDVSKPVLAAVIGTGVVSYIDASRDALERKETMTRLAVIVPYLLFGKELGAYALAKAFERSKVVVGKGLEKPMGELVKFTDGQSPFKKMWKKDSFLNMGVTPKSIAKPLSEASSKIEAFVDEALQKAAKDGIKTAGRKEVVEQLKADIISKHGSIWIWGQLLSAAISGTGLCWVSNKATSARYKHQQEELKNQALQQQSQAAPLFALPNAAFAGRPPQASFPTNAFAARPLAQPSPFAFPVPQRVAAQ